MKIRADFVTNSSSSSFLSISMENSVLAKIIKEYEGRLNNLYLNINVEGDGINIDEEDFGGWGDFPETKDEMVLSLIGLISNDLYEYVGYEEWTDEEVDRLEVEDDAFEMAVEMYKQRDEIMDAMVSFSAELGVDNWGDATEASGGQDYQETKTARYSKDTDEFEYDYESDLEDWDEWDEDDEDDEDWDEE